MALYRLMVTLPYDSGLPEDVVQNTWWIGADTDGDAEEAADALIVFYQAIDGLFSNVLNTATDACRVTAYLMTDPEPRVPTSITLFDVPGATGNPLPLECSIVLSYRTTITSGDIPARRKGRVYLGPFDTSTVDSQGMLDVVSQDVIRDAADALLTASQAGAGWFWGQHSTFEPLTINEVVAGYVDNEWDTQRRRGRVATSRLSFS